MTDEQRAVSSWLYSLNKIEWALENLDRSIEETEHRLSKGRIKATDFDRVNCSNSNIGHPTEIGALALCGYSADQERLDYLLIIREEYLRNLSDYEWALEKMVLDAKWGALAKDILQAKFRRKVVPDEKIYSNLFCTKETFYRTLRRAIQFYAEVLPSRFSKKMTLS